jgi:hypothetical protein
VTQDQGRIDSPVQRAHSHAKVEKGFKRFGPIAFGVVILASVSLAPSAPSRAARPRGIPVCDFQVGDSVFRGNVGAAVPPPGQGVVGNSDGPSTFSEITVETSKDGVVTIAGRQDDVTFDPETCLLP